MNTDYDFGRKNEDSTENDSDSEGSIAAPVIQGDALTQLLRNQKK
jgi:hypothetical protein